VLPQTAENILTYLEKRNASFDSWGDSDDEDKDPYETEVDEGIACINVHGAITYRPVYGACGETVGTSYMGLVKEVQEAISLGAKTIVFNFDSCGGQAAGCFEAANEIRSLCDENDVALYSYLDMMACSAGYALACVADEVIANPSAEAGSIGCVVALQDTSEAMRKLGVKRIFVTSGSEKVPFDEDGSFKQSFIDDIQADVNRLNMEFTAHVSNYTGLSADEIVALQANTFNAYKAKEIGLVNQVMTKNEFVTYIAGKQKNKGVMYAGSN
jgi:ClpP class serine protease